MIYATIDVDLVDHDKAVAAGPAMYLWTWAMLWSRRQKRDGFIPAVVVRKCGWGLDDEANLSAARVLVAAGLWAESGTDVGPGWVVLKYSEKNDTSEDIEYRIAAAAERQKRSRAGRRHAAAPEPVTHESRVTSESVTRESHVALGAGAVVKILDPGVQGGPAPAESDPLVKPETPMSSGCAAIVETVRMAKGSIADPYGEWLKFAGHFAGRLRESELVGRWQKWLVRASELQQRELAADKQRNATRDKNYRSAAEAAADVGYTPPPRAATATQRRLQEEYDAQAIPIPKDVLEAFSKIGTGTPN